MTHADALHERFEGATGVEAALYAIAIAIEHLAHQVKYLGNGDASTPMGAIEAFGAHVGEKIDMAAIMIATAIEKAE